MKPKYIALIPIMSGLSVMGQIAYAQQTPELDLTMEVMEEGEVPDGFINRIELPPPEFFNSDSNNFDLSDSSTTDVVEEDSADAVEIVEQAITDTIRETISIDGTGSTTGGGSVGGIVNLPDGVDAIINDTLPLDDSLEETLDDAANGVVDGIDDIVDGSTDAVGDIVDNLGDDIGDTVDDTTDTVDDTLDDVTGSAGDVVDSTTDLVDGATDTAALTGSLETIDNSIDDIVEDTGIVDDFDDALTDPETETIIEFEDTLAPLVEDVTDAIPGI